MKQEKLMEEFEKVVHKLESFRNKIFDSQQKGTLVYTKEQDETLRLASWALIDFRYAGKNGDSSRRCLSAEQVKSIVNKPDPAEQHRLGLWLEEQRKSFKAGTLSKDKIKKLKSIGFKF